MSGDVRRLSSVTRFSGIPVSVPETTAEHSFWVSLYSYMIHLENYPDGGGAILGEVLSYALVHDLAESVTGDVVRVFKYSTPELKQEIDRAEDLLAERLPEPVRTAMNMSGKKEGPNKEYVKEVVKIADFLSLFQYMRREALRGNMEIHPFFKRMVSDFYEMSIKSKNRKYKLPNKRIFYPEELYALMASKSDMIYKFSFKGLKDSSLFVESEVL